MQLSKIIDILSAEIHTYDDLDIFIANYHTFNLLSEILKNPANDSILLTKLANVQVIRTAEITDIKAVMLVHNNKPSPEMIRLAARHEISLFSTEHPLKQCCMILRQYGVSNL